jgi:hypothetical protein
MMTPGKTPASRKPKKRPKREVAPLPTPASDGPVENDRFDEPSLQNRESAVSMEKADEVRTRREDPDVCGLDDETVLDASDLH